MRADLTLALDLEGTLITNAVSQLPRPGLHEFLEWTRTAFGRVVLFTAVPAPKVRQILGNLVSQGEAPAWALDLGVLNPGPLTVPWGLEPVEKKDLRVLGNPARVLLVDDHEGYVVHEQRDRWVPVTEFTGDPQDQELARVREELERRIQEFHRERRGWGQYLRRWTADIAPGGTVPVSEDAYGEPCVLLRDIPARAQESFNRFILGSACPVARPGDGEACYVHDYVRWLGRGGEAYLPEAGLREEGTGEKEG